MKSSQTLLLVLALAMSAPLRAGAAGPQQAVKEITMTARKYKFEPNLITVTQGQKVRLIITAADHDHGFELKEYGIHQKLLKGKATTVEFTADKAGEFGFHCSVFCGLGHPKMKGKLIVEKTN